MFSDPSPDSVIHESSESGRPLVVVATGAPPGTGGTSLVVHRILSAPGMPTLRIFADRRVRRRVRASTGAILPGRYRWLWKAPTTSEAPRLVQWVFGCVNLLSGAIAGLRAARVCRSEDAGWVLSVVDSGMSQVAGSIAARLARVPHVLWVLDLWEENTYPKFDLLVARRLERRLWRGAAAILVHSEEAAEHYVAKHGVRCRVLRTPIRDPSQPSPRPPHDSRSEILCAGALYWAQEDAVRRLERAIIGLESDLTLTILGEEETLTCQALTVDRIERGVSETHFRDRLARADLLFLGLSFDTAHPEIIRTAAPARFPEYLATGVPVIVHAPPGSHVVRRATELDIAEVVDQPTDEALRSAIQAVLDDPKTAAGRAARAQAAALEHDHLVVASQFMQVLRGALDPDGFVRATTTLDPGRGEID
jgi:glycosyltransferase involved in cell wall biosynthesis